MPTTITLLKASAFDEKIQELEDAVADSATAAETSAESANNAATTVQGALVPIEADIAALESDASTAATNITTLQADSPRRAQKGQYLFVSKYNPAADFTDLPAAYASIPSSGGIRSIRLDNILLGDTPYTGGIEITKSGISIEGLSRPILDLISTDAIINDCPIIEGTITVRAHAFATRNVCYSTRTFTNGADCLVFPDQTYGVVVHDCAFVGKARNSLFHCLLVENALYYNIRNIQSVNNVWGVALKQSHGSLIGLFAKNHNNGPLIVKSDGPKTVEDVHCSDVHYESAPDGGDNYYGAIYIQCWELAAHVKNVTLNNFTIYGGYLYLSNVNTSTTTGLDGIAITNGIIENPTNANIYHSIFLNSMPCAGSIVLSNIVTKGAVQYSISDPGSNFTNVRVSNFASDKPNNGFTAVTDILFYSGNGSPEGAVTAPIAAIYHRLNGGPGFQIYYKGTATGNTGWVAQENLIYAGAKSGAPTTTDQPVAYSVRGWKDTANGKYKLWANDNGAMVQVKPDVADLTGIGTMATQNATAVAITGGTASGLSTLSTSNTAGITLNGTGGNTNQVQLYPGTASSASALYLAAVNANRNVTLALFPNGTGNLSKFTLANASDVNNYGSVFLQATGAIATIGSQNAGSPAATVNFLNMALGNVGINQASDAGYKLDVGGTARVQGALTATGKVTTTQFQLSALNTAPSSATDTGTAGEVRITAGFIYVCTATNTWVRSALATW